ncbi:MAG: hypothetical protein KGJ32_09115 [Xanthomonadaceae bacterium]|nr:hypothetical protein [Xanthomonadaceae bacterium]
MNTHAHNLLASVTISKVATGRQAGNLSTEVKKDMTQISRSMLATIVTAGLAVFAFAPTAHAADMDAAKTLARTNNCFKCHAISRDKDGPGWKKVADKYKGNPAAEAKLIHHLTSGEMVTLADGSKVHHEIIKTDPANDTAQIKNLVDWILSL